ncbi:MAG: hypothetical protein MPW15_13475 [Candidatus Manganitrophus sp.]|nr:hypothetical protein [Candidatus Manganitrophus sp.]
MFGERGRPPGGLFGRIYEAVQFAAGRKLIENEIEASGNRRQEIVEFVGDPAGELADRFQLMGVPELIFQLFPFGDVV